MNRSNKNAPFVYFLNLLLRPQQTEDRSSPGTSKLLKDLIGKTTHILNNQEAT